MITKKSLQSWLTRALEDPVTQILSANSHLTRTQLETLLIDILAPNLGPKALTSDEKASLRLIQAKISRGSFNRTLKQAKQNMVKAIYTILLLGYLGIFESTTLDPYLEIANKLKTYMEAHKEVANQRGEPGEHLRIIRMIRSELEESLKHLSSP